MRSVRATLLLCWMTLGAIAPVSTSAAQACSAASGAKTLPLVELYTSEGCDSCPPADRWLRKTFPAGATPSGAAVLALHVDYWDSLGWRDRFADHAYTLRQQALVRAAGGHTSYTPQVFVQGRDRGLWREGAVNEIIDRVAADPARASIALGVHAHADALVVDLRATLNGVRPADAVAYIALTESGLSSSVTAGENAGVKLEHDHVVRALVAAPAFDARGTNHASLRVALPSERGANPAIVAFVQHRTTGEILQALTLPLCGA